MLFEIYEDDVIVCL